MFSVVIWGHDHKPNSIRHLAGAKFIMQLHNKPKHVVRVIKILLQRQDMKQNISLNVTKARKTHQMLRWKIVREIRRWVQVPVALRLRKNKNFCSPEIMSPTAHPILSKFGKTIIQNDTDQREAAVTAGNKVTFHSWSAKTDMTIPMSLDIFPAVLLSARKRESVEFKVVGGLF